MILSGTGHRPNKLGLDYSEKSSKLLRDFCLYSLESLFKIKKIDKGIVGGALGFDTALGQAFLEFGVAVNLALPYYGFGSNWPKASQEQLWSFMEKTEVVYTDAQEYAGPWQYAVRDKYMVDGATDVLALWNGEPKSGTGITVAYANKKNKPVTNLFDSWESYKKLS